MGAFRVMFKQAGRNLVMKRVLHKELMRGPKIQGAAILLFLGLLVILSVSVWHGFGTLAS
jgi:hypothetical protein